MVKFMSGMGLLAVIVTLLFVGIADGGEPDQSMDNAYTRQDGTEPPFRNAYWNKHRKGINVDAASGEPLFSSKS